MKNGQDKRRRHQSSPLPKFQMTDKSANLVVAEARRYLYRAWLDWAHGCDLAREEHKVGYLIDVFDDAVEAAALLTGVDREAMWRGDEDAPSVARRSLATGDGNKMFGRDTQQLVERMEKLKGSGGSNYSNNLARLEDEHVLDDVARAIDPTGRTTSFDFVARNRDEIVKEVSVFTSELAGRSKRH